MKIEIRNLGVVEQAEIDLKPLTIFVGPNNTGKTWTAYTLSAILGPYGWNRYKRAYASGEISEVYPMLDNAIEQLFDEGNAKIDLIRFTDEYAEIYFNNIARLAPSWMQDFMSTERVSFEELEVHMTFLQHKEQFLEQIRTYSFEQELSVGRRRGKALLKALKEPRDMNLYFYTEGKVSEKLPQRAIREFLAGRTFQILHRALYPYVYLFPTERTTVVTFQFVKEEPKETVETIEPSHQDQTGIQPIEPVRTFIELLVNSLESNSSERERQASDNPKLLSYIQLANFLERGILNGRVNFSKPEGELRQKLLFEILEDTALEIPIASSMVKELSPLVLYLRLLAEPGEWLIIDEPEMNLHPEAQVRLVEFLAMLVNAGLNILFTTHSPYMVDHLSNLITAAKQEDKESIKNLFYLQRTEAFIPKEKVSVYLFDNGTAKSILDEEGIIHWGTFSHVSDRVAKIYAELL